MPKKKSQNHITTAVSTTTEAAWCGVIVHWIHSYMQGKNTYLQGKIINRARSEKPTSTEVTEDSVNDLALGLINRSNVCLISLTYFHIEEEKYVRIRMWISTVWACLYLRLLKLVYNKTQLNKYGSLLVMHICATFLPIMSCFGGTAFLLFKYGTSFKMSQPIARI